MKYFAYVVALLAMALLFPVGCGTKAVTPTTPKVVKKAPKKDPCENVAEHKGKYSVTIVGRCRDKPTDKWQIFVSVAVLYLDDEGARAGDESMAFLRRYFKGDPVLGAIGKKVIGNVPVFFFYLKKVIPRPPPGARKLERLQRSPTKSTYQRKYESKPHRH